MFILFSLCNLSSYLPSGVRKVNFRAAIGMIYSHTATLPRYTDQLLSALERCGKWQMVFGYREDRLWISTRATHAKWNGAYNDSTHLGGAFATSSAEIHCGLFQCVVRDNVTSTLDLWLKRVWSRLLTRTTRWPMSDHERSVGNGLNG